MNQADYHPVGKIHKPYGLKGEVKISFEAFFVECYEEVEVLFLPQGESYLPYFIETLEWRGENFAIVKLEEVDSKEQAALFNNRPVFIDKTKVTNFEDLFEEQNFFDYLIDFQMILDDGLDLGKIQEVLYFPQQQLAQLFYEGKEVLIPIHEDYIVEVKEEEKVIKMSLPEGLLEVYLDN